MIQIHFIDFFLIYDSYWAQICINNKNIDVDYLTIYTFSLKSPKSTQKRASARNEDLPSMLSLEISHLISLIIIRHQFGRYLASSWECSSFIKRTFLAKLYINDGEQL